MVDATIPTETILEARDFLVYGRVRSLTALPPLQHSLTYRLSIFHLPSRSSLLQDLNLDSIMRQLNALNGQLIGLRVEARPFP